MNIVDNLKDQITELDLLAMFRASKYITLKHDPSVLTIQGALIPPIIVKQKTLPVYRPIILKTIGGPYYILPDTIALTHLNDRYQVFSMNDECTFSQNTYLCPSDIYTESLEQKTELEKFISNEEHALKMSVASHNQNYSIGVHGVYIKSGVRYLTVFNASVITNRTNHTCKDNEFVNFEDFDTMIIEGSVISESYRLLKSFGQKSIDRLETILILSKKQIRHVNLIKMYLDTDVFSENPLDKLRNKHDRDVERLSNMIYSSRDLIALVTKIPLGTLGTLICICIGQMMFITGKLGH